MRTSNKILEPDYEWVAQQSNESIHFIQHGVPSDLIRWHHHREYELRLIRVTTGKMFVGNYIGSFAPGNLVLIGPDLPHNWISERVEGETVALRDQVIHFSSRFIEDLQSVAPELKALDPMLKRSRLGIEFRDEATIAQATGLFDRIADAQGMKRLIAFFELLELLTDTSSYRTLSSEYSESLACTQQLEWLDRAVHYILQHYVRELTQEEVARHMDISATQFSKRFKRAAGHRFIDFVNQLRVNKVCEYLVNSELPITEICFSVGYNNIANFNRRFLDIKGMTPSEYRRSYLNVLQAS